MRIVVGIRTRVSMVVFLSLAVWLITWFSVPGFCVPDAAQEAQPVNSGLSESEKNFGIRIVSLRPTAGGQMLDLRFQVVDAEKARVVLDKNKKAYLLDEKTGKTLPVPVTKAGSMRQTTLKPVAGKIYFILFSNSKRTVREGGTVSLVIGDFRKDGMIVEASGGTPSVEKPLSHKEHS